MRYVKPDAFKIDIIKLRDRDHKDNRELAKAYIKQYRNKKARRLSDLQDDPYFTEFNKA
jgi:hypothetical protein